MKNVGSNFSLLLSSQTAEALVRLLNLKLDIILGNHKISIFGYDDTFLFFENKSQVRNCHSKFIAYMHVCLDVVNLPTSYYCKLEDLKVSS